MTGVSEQPAIITCALIGGLPSSNPHHPGNLQDIIREGIAASRAGAAILHIHARTQDGHETQDPEVYREIGDEIHSQASDVVLNFTTAGSPWMSEDERLLSLDGHPDIASLDAGSMNFGKTVLFVNSESFIERMAREMASRSVKPELECFDTGMVMTGRRLVNEGLVPPPPLFQFVLGVRGGVPARVDMLATLVGLLPEGAKWSGVAVGSEHFPLMAAVLALGGHVRTGLEDVAYSARGVYARSNAELVERAVAMCAAVGRPVATPAQARACLELVPRPTAAGRPR
jgi:3-keto-5-aminohexanoate cleavage enzyme